MVKVAILGHSFVSGYKDHLKFHSHHGQHLSPHEIATHFRVSNIVNEVHLCGINGAKVCEGTFISNDFLERIQPEVCILDIGSNDLAAGTPPLTVADRLVDIATRLISRHHVKVVIVCSVLYRTARVPSQFHELVHSYNKILSHFTVPDSNIVYWTYYGFWDTTVSQWSRDGIHPNTQTGRKKYAQSLRQAMFQASCVLHSL